jgi:hypothetical protein
MKRERNGTIAARVRRWRLVAPALAFVFALTGMPAAAQSQTGAAGLAPALELAPEIVVSALDNKQYLPAAAYNAKHDEYLVVWHNDWGGGYRDIYAQRVTARGELKSWFAVSAGVNSRAQPSVAYDPVRDRYLVAWIYDVFGDGSDWDVYGRFIPWNGPDSTLGEFVICDWASSQWNPDVVYANTQDEFLVVWTNTPTGQPAYISARRIFAAGGFPDNKGFTVASHATEPRVRPDVAYNAARNEYLAAYDNNGDIYGARISATGSLLAGGEFPIAGWPDMENSPAVAACAGADQYLVVWQSLTPDKHEIYGRFLTGAGVPQTVIHLQQTPNEEEKPEVVCDPSGRNYLVIWQQEYGSGGTKGMAVRPVHTNGSMGGIWGSMGATDLDDPVVAAGGVNMLAVWEQQRGNSAYQDIHGCLIHMERLFVPALIK